MRVVLQLGGKHSTSLGVKLLSPVEAGRGWVIFVQSLDDQELIFFLLLDHAIHLTASDQHVAVAEIPLSVAIAYRCDLFIRESALERIGLREGKFVPLKSKEVS